MDRRRVNLVQYGLSSGLADMLIAADLTVTKIKTLPPADLVAKYGLSAAEAQEASSCVKRSPIDEDILLSLLQNSNFTCCVCKGVKGKAFIIDHIIEYALSQDNSYDNLAVLCPNDHDLAHRKGGLALSITAKSLRRCKYDWESAVEKANAAKADQAFDLDVGGIDYINIKRVEDLCIALFGGIPSTPISAKLRSIGMLNSDFRFDKKFVKENLSLGGSYLFDFPNCSESIHYKTLLQAVSEQIKFEDLAASIGRFEDARLLQGKYAFFIGGVYSKQPDLPIDDKSPPITMFYTKARTRIEWVLDPNYLLSMSAIGRLGKKTRFLIYSFVRGVERGDVGSPNLIDASPLLICQPSVDYDRTPAIAYMKRHDLDINL